MDNNVNHSTAYVPRPGQAGSRPFASHPRVSGPEVETRPYDFEHPVPLRAQQLDALRLATAGACDSLQRALTQLLRHPVGIEFLSVEQSTYRDYLTASDEPTCLGVFAPADSAEVWLLDTNRCLAFTMIDCLLGGVVSGVTLSRPFTAVETHVIQKALSTILRELTVDFLPTTPLPMTRLISDGSLIAEAGSNAAVALVSLEVVIGPSRGLVQLCVPWKRVPHVSVLLQETERGPNERMRVAAGKVRVQVSARLAQLKLSTRDVANLCAGDLLLTDNPVTGEISLMIDDHELFRGTSGQSHNRRSLVITSSVGTTRGVRTPPEGT
ncbi:FliM/FliN family flagellar motor switch protein [Schlesneria sp. T3-172]|uniref:FliM/FliN family flagellar motor switch protein n=1 Tax=Schlesneria sphaerica TaxID=3373610 RepID=UPI0037CA35A3